MKNRRDRKLWKIKFRLKIFEFFLGAVIVLNLFLSYMLWNLCGKLQGFLVEQKTLIFLSLGFALAEVLFLIIILVFLHRTLEPFPRMEELLEKALQGDYSLRLNLRKKDLNRSFVEKMNKVLDLLERRKEKRVKGSRGKKEEKI